MARKRFGTCRRHALILILALLASAGIHAQILNSERIERTFGSYGIDVIATDHDLRISNLYSLEEGHKVTRTYAVVETPSRVDQAIEGPHAAIRSGGSIGATFKAAGWDVVKRNLYFGRAGVPPAVAAAMGIGPDDRVAMHAYVLEVSSQDARYEYATIVELHHPDYLELDDLIRIYAPVGSSAGREAPASIRLMLIRAGQTLQSIPSALGQ